MQNEDQARRLRAWSFSALSVPAAMALCRYGWAWVLGGSVLAAGIVLLQQTLQRRTQAALPELFPAAFGKTGGAAAAALTLGWLLLAAGAAANLCQMAFEEDLGPLSAAVPLLLALLACRNGTEQAARACAAASLALGALYAVIMVSSLQHIQPDWCTPWGGAAGGAEALLLCLTPACMLYLAPSPRKCASRGYFALTTLFAPALAFLTAACLSPQLTARQAQPLYMLTKSLSVLSVMQRFEVLLSVAEMLGVLALLCMLVCAAQKTAGQLLPRMHRGDAVGAFCAGAFALSFASGYVPLWVWAAGCGIFWGILPILTQVIVDIKKIQKF